MDDVISFNDLPCEIRNRLIKDKRAWLADHESPEGSKWVFMRVPLDDLYCLGGEMTDKDEDEDKAIERYKNEYLERSCYEPLILGIDMLYIIDGYHHLYAFRKAVDEDETLPNIIECWVRVT